jgi:hypothetical protein
MVEDSNHSSSTAFAAQPAGGDAPVMADYFAGNGAWPRVQQAPRLMQQVPTRGDRLINLNQTMEFLKPVKVGDRLSSRMLIADVYEKGIRLDPKAVWIVRRGCPARTASRLHHPQHAAHAPHPGGSRPRSEHPGKRSHWENVRGDARSNNATEGSPRGRVAGFDTLTETRSRSGERPQDFYPYHDRDRPRRRSPDIFVSTGFTAPRSAGCSPTSSGPSWVRRLATDAPHEPPRRHDEPRQVAKPIG